MALRDAPLAIGYTFGEGPKAVTFVARPVGLGPFYELQEKMLDKDGEAIPLVDQQRLLLSTLVVIKGEADDAPENPIKAKELDELLSPKWAPGEVLQLVSAVRVVNEAPTGKAWMDGTGASSSSKPPVNGD